jgi:predicted HicB family RNase H-like nuclease
MTLPNQSAAADGKTSQTKTNVSTTLSLWLTTYQYMKKLKSKIINIKVSEETKEKLQKEAIERDISLAQIVREAIVNNNKTQ